MATAVCSSTDRKFLPAACLALKTAADRTGRRADVAYFLFADESVSESDLENARQFLDGDHPRVNLVPDHGIDLTIYDTRERPIKPGFYRLHYHEYLSPEYTRIVHIDADMRVEKSLVDLVRVDLAGRPLGAVHDLPLYARLCVQPERAIAGLTPEGRFFSSGLIVIDRTHGDALPSLTRAQKLLRDPECVFPFEDQTALNVAFDDNWRPIDPRWNLNDYLYRAMVENDPIISHFTSVKPWQAERSSDLDDFARWYADQTANSPWPDFVEPRTNTQDYAKVWWKTVRRNALLYKIQRFLRFMRSKQSVRRDYLIATGKLKQVYDLMVSEAAGTGVLPDNPQGCFE